MFGPGQSFLVGVEDTGDGALKCYLGHRSRGLYALVEDAEAQERIRSAWGRGWHVLIPTPPAGCIYSDAESGAAKENER